MFFYVINTISAIPNNLRGCCGTTYAGIAKKKYVRHGARINGHSFRSTFCHRSHNMVCFVLPSCCITAGSDNIALLPTTFIRTLHGYRSCVLVRIKPFFIPVDIQCTHCMCPFLLGRYLVQALCS